MREGFVVPVREKVAFGVGDFANNLAMTAINFYFIFYIVNVAGIPPVMAGVVYWVSRTVAACTDLLMGIVSDRTTSRFGRRRVYLLCGAVPLGVFFALLWLIPGLGLVGRFVFYLVGMLLFNVTFSLVTIPYNALMPELTQSYDERTSISGFRMAFSFLGNLVAAAGVALIVDNLWPGRASYPSSYPVMGVIFGAATAALVIVAFLGTRERIHAEAEKILGRGFWQEVRSLWKVREVRLMVTLFVLNQVAADLFMAMVIFFLKDVVRIPDDITSLVMATPLVIAVAAAPLWVFLGDKLGKKRAYIVGAVFFLIPLLMVLAAPPGNVAMVMVIAVLMGIGSSATQVLPWSMLPDVVEFDELANGVRREGFYMGVTQLTYKASSALFIFLATALIGAFGYVENNPSGTQPAQALLAVRIVLGVGTSVLYLAAASFAWILPLTRERFEETKRLIRERAGKR
jgi:glycoside/pentoside/hexuronide:cation symporter, GPH family